MGQTRILIAAVACTMTALSGMSCGGTDKKGNKGEGCFRAEECAAGLVCIAEACTDDLSSVNIRADAGAPMDDGGAGTTGD